jgi:hypothetical protein
MGWMLRCGGGNFALHARYPHAGREGKDQLGSESVPRGGQLGLSHQVSVRPTRAAVPPLPPPPSAHPTTPMVGADRWS